MLLMLLKSAFVTQSGFLILILILILILVFSLVARTFPTGEANNTT